MSTTDPLATYLHDHFAGSTFAVQLLESMRDCHPNEPLGEFAISVLADVEQDRAVLQKIIDGVGQAHLDLLEAAAWLMKKASQFKLQHDHAGGLATFEALETLSPGILGKAALWRALAVISQSDPRVQGFDYEHLEERAQDQHARVDGYRIGIAASAFDRSGDSSR